MKNNELRDKLIHSLVLPFCSGSWSNEYFAEHIEILCRETIIKNITKEIKKLQFTTIKDEEELVRVFRVKDILKILKEI